LSIVRAYSAVMPRFHSLPQLWLVSDERNDAALEGALARLPRGSGFIYRHYHLDPADRVKRYRELERAARRRDHLVILADSAQTATEWGADGTYAAPRALDPRRAGLLRLATVHSAREIAEANRAQADAVLLSPAFPTRTHPDAHTLGPVRFRLLGALSNAPVIALGGMTQKHADRLKWPLWAAIDGLS
jgi:thiamine-phosphate pyrophosphorylase